MFINIFIQDTHIPNNVRTPQKHSKSNVENTAAARVARQARQCTMMIVKLSDGNLPENLFEIVLRVIGVSGGQGSLC